MLIDAHIHMYATDVFEDPQAWALANNEKHWLACIGPDKTNSLQGWATVEQLLKDMDAAGVDKAVMLGWYWEHHTSCIEQNTWYAKWIQQHPDRLMAFGMVQPLADRTSVQTTLQQCLDYGFVGLGEFLPQAQGYHLKHPRWLEVVDFATEHQLPINIHVTEPVGRQYAGKIATPLEDYTWLAEQYPETIFILAHLGGLLPLYETNSAVKKAMKNVYYDTAAVPFIYDKRIYKTITDTIGFNRIIYGSDYPLRVYPKKNPLPSLAPIIKDIRSHNFDPTSEAQILAGNLLEILSKKSKPLNKIS